LRVVKRVFDSAAQALRPAGNATQSYQKITTWNVAIYNMSQTTKRITADDSAGLERLCTHDWMCSTADADGVEFLEAWFQGSA
jgi:hypothetical protein